MAGNVDSSDQVVLVNDRVLVVNRMPVAVRGREVGAVITLRDRTELEGLMRELNDVRSLADALRAQEHEFSHRLHVIAGLMEVGRHDEAVRFIRQESLVRQALEDKPLTVFGDGSQTRSFCYVDDMIKGMYLLAMSKEHTPINLGNPKEFTILELAETVIRVTGSRSEIVYEALPVDDPQTRQPDITLAKEILGWKPEIELEEGLRRMLPSLGREPVSV
jgi:dTDP-4-dehydrorhamnose reductase